VTSRADAVRRCADVAVGSAVLVAGAPVLGAVALAVRATMGSPVLFRQRRAGRDGVPFDLVKFRTMRHPEPGREGPEFDAERLTRLGSLLRSTSLDELPGFWNLVRGDVTLVGPRPLPVHYVDYYCRDEIRRLDVKPGITGLAQVSGRNELDWDRRLALDVQYVRTRSLRGDLAIVLRTVGVVLRRSGVSEAGGVTMTELPADRAHRRPSPAAAGH